MPCSTSSVSTTLTYSMMWTFQRFRPGSPGTVRARSPRSSAADAVPIRTKPSTRRFARNIMPRSPFFLLMNAFFIDHGVGAAQQLIGQFPGFLQVVQCQAVDDQLAGNQVQDVADRDRGGVSAVQNLGGQVAGQFAALIEVH